MRLMNNKLKLFFVILILFLCFLFFKEKNTYAVYSETLSVSPSISLTISDPVYDVIYYLNDNSGNTYSSTTKIRGETLGSVTPPTRTGYNFAGWYTDPDPTNGTKVGSNYQVNADTYLYAHWAQIVCKKATTGTLFTESCGADGACLVAMDENDAYLYSYGNTITYGTIAGAGFPVTGDAYDCDVDNDGDYTGGGNYSERFYFVRERVDSSNDIDNAVLVHYTSFDQNGHEVLTDGNPDSSSSRKAYTNSNGKQYLPNATVWSNPALVAFDGKASRYISVDDITTACGESYGLIGLLDNKCHFFMENTRFQRSGAQSSYYMNVDGPDNYTYIINILDRNLIKRSPGNTTEGTVRPVIEIPYNAIDGYTESELYTVSFDVHCVDDCNETSQISSIKRHYGEPLGSLPEPYRGYREFLGWYTSYDNDTYSGLINSSSVVTGNVTLHAKWGWTPAFEVENIGTYTSFGDVLNHVPNNTQTTVTLLKNISTSGTLRIPSTKNIVLDLGGYTITNAKARNLIENEGTLELKNGKLKNISDAEANYWTIENENGATLRITGGTYIANHGIVVKNYGNITMTNGIILTGYNTGTFNNEVGGVFNISGGSIINDGQKQAIYNNGGDVTISGTAFLSSFTTTRAAFQNLNNGTATISGGTIENRKNFQAITVESGTVTIGDNDDTTISTTTPIIIAKGYGLVASGGSVYFKDGIMYSRNHSSVIDSSSNPYLHLQDTRIVPTTVRLPATSYSGSVDHYAVYLEFDDMVVTFDPDGGTLAEPYNTDPHMSVQKYTQITSLPSDPVKTDYVFGGWYLDTDTTYQNRINVGYTVTGAITLVARWIPAYGVGFDSNGGSPVATLYVAQNTSLTTLPPNPTRLGYIFDGWYIDDDTFTQQFTTPVVIQSYIEVHAKWLPSILLATTTPSPSTTITINEGASTQIAIDVTGITGIEDYTCVSNDTSIATVTKDNNTGNCIVTAVYYGITTIDVVGVDSNDTISFGIKVNFNPTIPTGKKARLIKGLGEPQNEYYDTLQAAVSDVPNNNKKYVVILYDNVAENIVVNAGQNIEFDFQNYTITAYSDDYTLNNSGTVTMNNGHLASNVAADKGKQTVINQGTGIFTLNDGSIEHTYSNAVRNNGGTFNMNGGSISVASSSAQGAVNNETSGNYPGIMNISGGTITADARQAIYNNGANTILTISGNAHLESAVSETTRRRATLQNESGTVYIYGGTIISTSDTSRKSPAVLNKGTMIIGDSTNGVDITTPVIRGITNGLMSESGTVSINGGIIMAKSNNAPTSGSGITPLSGYDFSTGTETIGGILYNTKFIVPTQ